MRTAGAGGGAGARAALEKLCRRYWYPLYAYVRRQGVLPAEAEDLTQAFFADIVQRNDFAVADPDRGRFRTFLMTSCRNFMTNAWKAQRTAKRGGDSQFISFDQEPPESRYRLEPVDHSTPERLFDRRWALTVIERTLSQLRQEYAEGGRTDLFEELKTTLTSKVTMRHAEIADRHGISVSAVGVTVFRLKQRFAEVLRQEIATTVSTAVEIEEEIRYLVSVLAD